MVCPANSSYSFWARPFIFCRQLVPTLKVCILYGFWFSTIIYKSGIKPHSINQPIEHHIVRYRLIYFSHFCLMLNKQNIGLPFAIITAGVLYVSYRHKLRHKHLLKSIHKFSTSYPMNNIPFLEMKLYWKSILALQDVFFTL
jgi:hypothetical protein